MEQKKEEEEEEVEEEAEEKRKGGRWGEGEEGKEEIGFSFEAEGKTKEDIPVFLHLMFIENFLCTRWSLEGKTHCLS